MSSDRTFPRSSDRTITRALHGSAYTPDAVQEVLPLVYDELRRLAAHVLKGERHNHTLVATELVHEAYVRLFGLERMEFKDRRHFFATAAMAMRRILVEYERRRRAEKRIPPGRKVAIEDAEEVASPEPDLDVLALDSALDTLSKLSERQARVIELSFFGGLTETQIGDVLEVSRATVARDARAAKLWLRREMRGA